MNTATEPKNKVGRHFKNVEAFQKWAYEQEFGYEFAGNKVTEKEIKNWNLGMIWNLENRFRLDKSFKKAALIRNFGLKTGKNFRVPDLAYFTAEQHFAAVKGNHPIPQLAIEFLSKSESAEDIADKINDYFASGVKMVWYVYPKTEMIYVYTSPKDIKVLQGDDVCSASPVIADFEFPAKEIFKKELSLS